VLRPYRDVLSMPGALAFSAAGLVGRLPISMLGIGIVLLVSDRTGSYATAGAVAAVFGLVQATAAPQVARLVDRFGQARVLRPAIVVHAAGVLSLVTAVESGAPTWTYFLAAVVAGVAMGSLGALVRARWSHLVGNGPRLHTAFSWESVLDEVVFILGPVLVTVLATRIAAPAGLLTSAAAGLVGGLAFTLLRRTEPPPSGRSTGATTSLLRIPGLLVLMAAFICVGGIFGSVEVTAVGFTEELGSPGAAGFVLAVFALGSMISGIGYGAVHWRSAPGRRFQYGVLLLAVGIVPFALATEIPSLAIAMFFAGFAISPTIIAGNALVQSLVAPARLTEGLTWMVTAMGLGTAGSAALAGWTIDAFGAHRAFLVSVGCGLLAAVMALVGSRWLRSPVDAAGTTAAAASTPDPEAQPAQPMATTSG
jgi:MFS family permease